MRDLFALVLSYNRRKDRELEAAMIPVACSTAEIVNMLGSIYSTEKNPWKSISPKEFIDRWLGKEIQVDVTPEYIDEVLRGIKEREASVLFRGQKKKVYL